MTTALVSAAAAMARRLRPALFAYLAAVAVTRIAFGAHFPLDVALGTILGWQVGLFSVALMRAARLLPAAPALRREPAAQTVAPVPAPA